MKRIARADKPRPVHTQRTASLNQPVGIDYALFSPQPLPGLRYHEFMESGRILLIVGDCVRVIGRSET